MRTPDDNRLADQLNKDPIVFADCTGPEILLGFGIGMTIGILAGILLGASMGTFMLGLIFGLLIGLGLTYLALTQIANARNKYYESWLAEKFFIAKTQLNIFSEPNFISLTRRFSRSRR